MNLKPTIEFQSAEEIIKFQETRLLRFLPYVFEFSPYYKRLINEAGIDAASIQSLNDFSRIPPTSKDDFHSHNWDFLCVPKKKIVEYTSTSGTLGSPVTVALTENDLQRLAFNESISFACADGSKDDLYQLMLTLDRQFMAGMAYYEGIRRLGAGLIRVGPGLPEMQWEVINRLKPTALVVVPSFLVKLIDYANDNGISLENSSVRKAICIGEGLRTSEFELNTLGRKISGAWNIRLYSTYASTEMQTAFTECGFGRGGHHHPELLHVELLDEDNRPVRLGDPGEITVTTIGVEAMPLLRYKTGDIAVAHQDTCACGRTTLRLGPVIGRKQQMIKLKGTTLYPPGIFELLNQIEGVIDYAVEVFTGQLGTDELRLYLLTEPNAQVKTSKVLKTAFQSRLKVVPDTIFIDQAQMEHLQMVGKSRKVKRFIDSRR